MRDNSIAGDGESDYMKKLRLVISIVLLVVFAVFVSLYVIDHKRMDNNEPVVFSTWGKKYSPPLEAQEISPQAAIEIAKNELNEKSIETIINYDNPNIEEIVADTNLSICCFEENVDIVGKELYKISFNTIHDGLLGPIVFYVDKMGGKLIGAEFRE